MIIVIAGVNGGGKSSVIGQAIRANGGEYYNPDEVAQILMRSDPELTPANANIDAWTRGKDALVEAIEHDTDCILETTLGGSTIPSLLRKAADLGRSVHVYFVGLDSPERHIQRVRARVLNGGHDIPEEKIRQRYSSSILNMVNLAPYCTEVRVWDNSTERGSGSPSAVTVFHMLDGEFLRPPREDTPEWAKPIAVALLKNMNKK